MPPSKAAQSAKFAAVLVLVTVVAYCVFTPGLSGNQRSSPQPLVPGFGVERNLPPVPGFGRIETPSLLRITDNDRREAEQALRHYDRNHDGTLDREELPRNRSDDFPEYDKNADGKLTLPEVALWFAHRRGANQQQMTSKSKSGGHGRSRSGALPGLSDREERKSDGRKSYRILPAKERLPEGLPDWFARRDSDGDGQVMMAEYATAWPDEVIAEFRRFDLNDDGIVTPAECLKATGVGAQRRAEEVVASIQRPTSAVLGSPPRRSAKTLKSKPLLLRAILLSRRRR